MAEIFHTLTFEKILKRNGAKRVSDKAAKEFATIMEEKIFKILSDAITLAKHAGRKTLLAEDIRMVRRRF
jgi:histone H3/H4